MNTRVKITVKADTKLYDTKDAKRRTNVLTKETIGWTDGDLSLDEERVLFNYPLYLSDGEETKTAYINSEDIILIDTLEETNSEDKREQLDEGDLTEEEVEIIHKNIIKHSTFIGGSYFDETPSYLTVRLKPRVVYDLDNKRLGNLPNEYNLISSNGETVYIQNKTSLQTFRVLQTSLVGY